MNNTKRSRFKVLDDGNPDAEGEVRVEHIGAEMRRVRTEKGLTVPFLAETLRIRESYLVAIEDGRFDQMPGPTYALGFVRSYADYLGLDGREMVRRFKDEVGNQAKGGRSGRLAFPSPLAEGRGSFGALLVLALVLGAAVYAGWYWYSDRQAGSGGIDAPLPGRVETPGGLASPVAPHETAPATDKSPDRSSPAGGSAPSGASSPSGADGSSTGGPAGGTAPGSAPLATAPAAAPGGVTTGGATPGGATTGGATPGGSTSPAQDSGASGIVILAKRDSWIQVRDDAGTMLTSNVLRAGETYRVPNRSGLTLMTGNAGGIEIVLDGRTLPPLGAEGTIRREISLDRDKLLSAAP